MTLFTSNFRPLWLRLLVVLVFFLIGNRVAQGPYRSLVVTPAVYTRQMIQGARQSWAVLGDSHTAAIPYYSFGALQLADGGDSFAEMRTKLALARRDMVNLRDVVIPADSHGFSTDRDRRNNRQKGVLLSTPETYERVYGGGAFDYWKNTALYSRLPLLNPVNARLTRRYLFHRFGWSEEQPVEWAKISSTEKRQRSKQRFLENYGSGLSENQHQQFNLLVADIREAKLKLIVVRYPESPSMRDLGRELPWVQALESELSPLSVLDFSREYNDEKDYRDQDHLMPGSRASVDLARRVSEEMNKSLAP